MPRSCAASFCQTNWESVKKQGTDIIFHQFPADKVLRRKWAQFCKREKNWKPVKNSAICSLHFKLEDYQLARSSLVRSNINFKRLNATAFPSLNPEEEMETQQAVECDQTDSKHYYKRTEICRTCLKDTKEESLIPIESQIQDMTVLDMLIQLTAFETENNDAFPKAICEDCKVQLELAFNIRQEFIVKAELLVQLVAEGKIMSCDNSESVFGGPDDDQEYIMSNMKEEPFCIRSQPLDVSEHETVDSCTVVESTEIVFDHQQLDTSELNDHSCYTKIEDQHEESSGEIDEKIAAEFEGAGEECVESIHNNVEREELIIKTEPSGTDSWEKFERELEQRKASIRKSKAEVRRALKGPRREAFRTKAKKLEEEARKRFPLTTCYICSREHDSITDRDFHLREHMAMLPYQCGECVEPIPTNKATADDDDDNDGEGAANVEQKVQPAVFKTTNQLNLHFRMHFMPHKCEKCYRRFSTVMKLKTHMWAFHGYGVNELTCEYCGKQYTHRIAFRKHVDSHRKAISGQFKCAICDRSFGVKSSLQRHEASHKGEKKYKCMYCDKLFSTSYNRLTHQRSHTGERPYRCVNCDRTFAQSALFTAHQEHCKEKKISISSAKRIVGPALLPSKDGRCPYPGCDYTSTRYSAMYVHKRAKHMPLYQCDVCSKSFAFKNKLNDHMMLHTGEKPHQCELCDRSFRRLEMYRRHLQTHKSDSNYSCTICRKTFKLPHYLQAHMLTHSSERRFACDLCTNSYKTKGELKKHTQRKHANEIVEEIIIKDLYTYEYVPTNDGSQCDPVGT